MVTGVTDNSSKEIVCDVIPVDGDVPTFSKTLNEFVPRATNAAPFTPTTSGDWPIAPTTIGEALNLLAARVKALEP